MRPLTAHDDHTDRLVAINCTPYRRQVSMHRFGRGIQSPPVGDHELEKSRLRGHKFETGKVRLIRCDVYSHSQAPSAIRSRTVSLGLPSICVPANDDKRKSRTSSACVRIRHRVYADHRQYGVGRDGFPKLIGDFGIPTDFAPAFVRPQALVRATQADFDSILWLDRLHEAKIIEPIVAEHG